MNQLAPYELRRDSSYKYIPSRLTFARFVRCSIFEKSTKYAPRAKPKNTNTMMGTCEARSSAFMVNADDVVAKCYCCNT
ncbi:hypothetical protein BLOT_011087 [Blomia tropicalis]|nr:hypothetical protein BLOT_011087 [Blomia tropicalis]